LGNQNCLWSSSFCKFPTMVVIYSMNSNLPQTLIYILRPNPLYYQWLNNVDTKDCTTYIINQLDGCLVERLCRPSILWQKKQKSWNTMYSGKCDPDLRNLASSCPCCHGNRVWWRNIQKVKVIANVKFCDIRTNG